MIQKQQRQRQLGVQFQVTQTRHYQLSGININLRFNFARYLLHSVTMCCVSNASSASSVCATSLSVDQTEAAQVLLHPLCEYALHLHNNLKLSFVIIIFIFSWS